MLLLVWSGGFLGGGFAMNMGVSGNGSVLWVKEQFFALNIYRRYRKSSGTEL